MNRRATEEYLFRKESSNESVLTLGTKESRGNNIDLTNVTDDDKDSDNDSNVTNVSPKKKTKAGTTTTTGENMDMALYLTEIKMLGNRAPNSAWKSTPS